ncbi:hypothetical protein AVEN_49060-1 [Araneus ventricosus]|uniref:Uncharacterized protein n=1 Tax=Araneus ventricosus TaxID=182803 RepID=A0A4Y2HW10_ARAVE|nr:hypothetical protein AVEN_49060-1 [Araneus ventricosus]
MECHFPAMLALWLGRGFYRGMYANARGIEKSIPDLGDHFGDEMWDLKNAGIFSVSLLGAEIIQMIPSDVTACRGDYKRTVLRSQSNSSVC